MLQRMLRQWKSQRKVPNFLPKVSWFPGSQWHWPGVVPSVRAQTTQLFFCDLPTRICPASGCFSATTQANTKFLSVRGSRDRWICLVFVAGSDCHLLLGIQPFCSLISATFWEPNLFGNQTFLGIQPFWESNRFVSIIKLSLLQDFATQVYHWTDYQKAVRDAQGTPGKYVTPALGEWLHGPTLMIPTFTKSIHRGNKTLHTHTLGQCHAMAQAFHKDGRILLSEAVCLETPQSFAVDGCQGLVATLAWCSWSVCPLYPFVLVLIFYLNPNKSKPPLFCLLAGRAISGGLPICRDRGARSWTCKARCSESVLAHFHNM